MSARVVPESEPIDDTLEEILDVAVSVLVDYGADGNTRIERLARWMVEYLGGVSPTLGVAPGEIYHRFGGCHEVARWTPDQARAYAIALLRAADKAEAIH